MTPNFSNKEMECKCGCGQLPNLALAKMLQLSRHIGGGLPIVISSCMRCEAHNENVGGVNTSLHIFGFAADVVRWGGHLASNPQGKSAIIDLFKQSGFWTYDESHNCVHVDLRLLFPEILNLRRAL